MHDLFESATTEVCCGYRLHKLEAYNWGTFDSTRGTVHTVRPNGATALLVGQNGSGKSTLVDALLTLLVRPNVRNYNVAAGAKKRERDERTYVKGACGRLSRSEDNGTQIEFLRPGNRHYSALLVCFRNERDEAFTLAQLLYLNSEGGVEKIYCYADGEKSIAEHCANLVGTEKVRRQMEDRGFKATDKYIDYSRWIERKTGMLPKAMDMFNQTVAVKDIQSLNDFIREHMLESKPWSERIDALQTHFTQLTQAYQSLVLVRRQFELLRPISERGTEYRTQAAALSEAEAIAAVVGPFFLQKRVELLAPVIDHIRGELLAVQKTKQRLEEEAEQSRDEGRRLKNQIEESGGDRLREIPHLIRNHELSAQNKRGNYDRFCSAATAAGLKIEVVNVASLIELHRSLPPLIQSLIATSEAMKAERNRKVLSRGDISRQVDEDRRELQALGARQTKLPEELAEVRRRICEDLRLSEAELPFTAELIMVDPSERAWEASAEMVLHSFARSLLVPVKHYAVVSGHLDRTRIHDDRGRGHRLVYLRVAERQMRPSPSPHSRSLLRKIRLKDGHPLVPWVRAELEERHNYLCCDTIEEFQGAHGPALTCERHVKSSSGTRHEKDDRDRAADPRFFVLGWDNRDKRRHLATEIERLGRDLEVLDREIDGLDAELAKLEARRLSAAQLATFTEYTELDFRQHEIEVERLREERRALEEGSEAIQSLKARLAQIEQLARSLTERRDETIRVEERLGAHLADAKRLVEGARLELDRMNQRGELAAHCSRFEVVAAYFADSPLTADDVVSRELPFREERHAEIDRLRRELEPLRDTLCSDMSRFLREFKEEQADLDARIEYLDGFCEKFEKIRQDDLPQHEKRFKERLNENVLREVGFLHGAFRTECGEIRAKIDLLNECLRQLEYRPGTRMRLEPRSVRDPEIVEFQTALRECLADTFERSDAADEARYVRVAKLLDRLRDDERWRHKVTDVRRWFDFAAIEFEVGTNVERHCYTDGSGQSGGEKAKLAFTILVAAIAYQYDIDPGRPRSDRFHFVVVDEMFSKVDDHYAEYALELFKKFGLQLLIVAPLDAKARVTEPYVGCYLHVSKDMRTNYSEVIAMTAQEFEAALLTPHALKAGDDSSD